MKTNPVQIFILMVLLMIYHDLCHPDTVDKICILLGWVTALVSSVWCVAGAAIAIPKKRGEP